MPLRQPFLKGLLIGLSIFILLNILAAHLLSDCGLGAVLRVSACSDDIVRVGFPFVFFEEGGIAFRSDFNSSILILDLMIGICFAWVIGFLLRRKKEKTLTPS